MSEELGAVLEAPEVIADEVVNEVPEGVAADAVEEIAPVEEVKGDERTMPQWIRNLKGTDPTAFKAAKADFFGKRAIDEKLKDFDLDGTKGWLEEHGGREAIVAKVTELEGKAAELDAISQKIQNADPSLVSDLTPEAVTKLGPVMDQQWQKADPEGWTAHVSGVFAETIRQNGIPMFLKEMGMQLKYGETDQLKQSLAQLQGWADSFQQKASAPRTTPLQQPKSDGKPSVKEERETWENEKFSGTVTDSIKSFRESTITKEISSYIARKPGDSIAKELAISAIGNKVHEILHKDQKFQDALNNFTARRDKAGYMKLLESREGALIQKLAPDIARSIFGNPGSTATPVARTPTGTPSKADVGFSFVDKAPKPELIDRFRTTDAMIMRGKFILKDGKKVSLEA